MIEAGLSYEDTVRSYFLSQLMLPKSHYFLQKLYRTQESRKITALLNIKLHKQGNSPHDPRFLPAHARPTSYRLSGPSYPQSLTKHSTFFIPLSHFLVHPGSTGHWRSIPRSFTQLLIDNSVAHMALLRASVSTRFHRSFTESANTTISSITSRNRYLIMSSKKRMLQNCGGDTVPATSVDFSVIPV